MYITRITRDSHRTLLLKASDSVKVAIFIRNQI